MSNVLKIYFAITIIAFIMCGCGDSVSTNSDQEYLTQVITKASHYVELEMAQFCCEITCPDGSTIGACWMDRGDGKCYKYPAIGMVIFGRDINGDGDLNYGEPQGYDICE